MSTGVLPFRGDTSGAIFDSILHKRPLALVRLNPDLPVRLEQVIYKVLEKDPNLRHQHASEIRVDLLRLKQASRTVTAYPSRGKRRKTVRKQLEGRDQRRPKNPEGPSFEAYQAYLRGRYYWNQRNPDGFKKALSYFQSAISKDPTYALAYAGLADCYAVIGVAEYGIAPPVEAMPKAKAAALKALEFDPTLAEAQTQVAHVTAFYEWDVLAAEREFRRAIELNRDYPFVHHWYACYLSAIEQHESALREEKRAQELDPLSPAISKNVGTMLYYAERFEQSIAQYLSALELDPNFARTHLYLGLAWGQTGEHQRAIAELERAIGLAGRMPVMVAALGYTYGNAGDRRRAHELLDELRRHPSTQYVPSFYLALICAGLGEDEEMFQWFEKAYDERSSWMFALKVEPMFNKYRTASRFRRLLAQIGLTT